MSFLLVYVCVHTHGPPRYVHVCTCQKIKLGCHSSYIIYLVCIHICEYRCYMP